MAYDPIAELNVTTQQYFMPVVINQIWKESPALYRIFRIAKEGDYGLALPRIRNWASKIFFDSGNAVIANPRQD